MLCSVFLQFFYPSLSFSRFFGKCGKFISVLLVFIVLCSFLVVNSFASSSSSISIRDFDTILWQSSADFTGTTFREFSYGGIHFTGIKCSNTSYYSAGNVKTVSMLELTDLANNTNYRINFKEVISSNISYTFQVYLGSPSNPLEYLAYDGSHSSGSIYTIDFGFSFNSSGTSSSNNNTLTFICIVPSGYGTNFEIGLTDIVIIDEDDDSGTLENILNWLSRIYHSIAGGEDREGIVHTGIVSGIVQGLTTLRNTLVNTLSSVRDSIVNSIEGISAFFVQLGEDIVQGLKDLFIPDDEFIDEFFSDLDTFLTEHFGALYQVPSLMVDFIRKLLTIPTGTGTIHIPSIQFTFRGETHTLLESQDYSFAWLSDSSHPLYYFYNFYRGFTYVILFFAFGNYCVNKYYKLFGGYSDDS